MNRNTFIGIIELILEQRAREDKFSETIKKAYLDAGECGDFRDAPSYTPATNVFIDALLDKLAEDFVSENQTLESAQDTINYYMYELSLMDWQFIEPIDPKVNDFEMHAVPAYMEVDGVKIQMSTPGELYDALIYCMEAHDRPEETISSETKLKSAIMAGKQDDTSTKLHSVVGESPESVEYRVKKIIGEQLGLDYITEIQSKNYLESDLGADSLDVVEIVMQIENEFGITFPDDWCPDTVEDLILMVKYQKLQK